MPGHPRCRNPGLEGRGGNLGVPLQEPGSRNIWCAGKSGTIQEGGQENWAGGVLPPLLLQEPVTVTGDPA